MTDFLSELSIIEDAANAFSRCPSLQSFELSASMIEKDFLAPKDHAWPGFQIFLSHLPQAIRKITVEFTSWNSGVVMRRLENLRELDWGPVEQALMKLRDLEFINFGFAFHRRDGAGGPSLGILSDSLETDVRAKLVAAQERGILQFSGVREINW